ncbi:MAG: GNAT family N-acetyltransferase [Pseudomonadota bacterium]|nr:GNAT family N-acetyltransferase [Pseudomonadota bacterium]
MAEKPIIQTFLRLYAVQESGAIRMGMIMEIETERLRLRQWRASDFVTFAQINADPEVMKYFPRVMSMAESNEFARKLQALISDRGWGLWAVEERQSGVFIGFVGLHESPTELSFSPCIEIGWRLGTAHWGRGYAVEAARAALKHAFVDLGFAEVCSFTSAINYRSRAVMERINMVNTNQNFLYPSIPLGSPLSEHVLYKITKVLWKDDAA